VRTHQTFFGASLIALATSGLSLPATAQSADTPYGTAKFSAYPDIESVKQLKVVWDFNFTDPKAVGVVFNNLNALLKATAEYGPHEIEPIKVVIVSHGPELVVFAKKNYEKYKESSIGHRVLPSRASNSKSVAMLRLLKVLLRKISTASRPWFRPDPMRWPTGNRRVTRSMRWARQCRHRRSAN
jgi:hypothetical protein